jgi:branched-chain amino acid transport system permease protein
VYLPSRIYIENSLLFSNTLVMLAVGLTLTYLTTKVPNFAHGSLAMVGAYALFTVAAIVFGQQLASYSLATPLGLGFLVAFAAGAAAGLLEYLLVLRPLSKRGTTPLGLMIATLGVDLILIGVLNIFADILRGMHPITGTARDWRLKAYVIQKVAGLSLGVWISFGIMIGSLVALYLLLTRTRFGIAMRASIENPALAQVLGVNVDLVNMVSWILAGGLAGLAGGMMAFVQRINPATGSIEVVAVFAASIVGGLHSLLGAVVGGYIVGMSETLLTKIISDITGFDLVAYKRAVPLIFIIVTLLVAPEGIMGVNWRRLFSRFLSLLLRRRGESTPTA